MYFGIKLFKKFIEKYDANLKKSEILTYKIIYY